MIEQISWDATLVKKFSSSNHYKMLNQLRSEVKKYPLTRKKNTITKPIKDNNIGRKNNQATAFPKEISISRIENTNNEKTGSKSTVSFNNSKNFSIYNNINNENIEEQKDNKLLEGDCSNLDAKPTTFKERLTKIDMN